MRQVSHMNRRGNHLHCGYRGVYVLKMRPAAAVCEMRCGVMQSGTNCSVVQWVQQCVANCSVVHCVAMCVQLLSLLPSLSAHVAQIRGMSHV